MPKKKKTRTFPFALKFILITLVVAGFGLALSFGANHFFRHSPYFRVRSVTIDPSLPFIDKRDLRGLIGDNIFEVDLKRERQRLSYKYPQASDLKIMKRFPSQISVVAKARLPFAKVQTVRKTLILDEDGFVLSLEGEGRDDMPVIVGQSLEGRRAVRGLLFEGDDVQAALEIAAAFKANKGLASYRIATINVGNLSKIQALLDNGLSVLMDQSDIAQKVRVLSVVLAQGNLDLKEVKYVDLRFKEPIIGKK